MMEHIIGLPSGQILNVNISELSELMKKEYVNWDVELSELIFKDSNYDKIIQILNKINIGSEVFIVNTNKIGIVEKIIKNYQGEEINNKDVSNIFIFGQTLYLVKFKSGNIGIYDQYQIKKNIISNDIFT